jgi:spoIIIJ-associated protein
VSKVTVSAKTVEEAVKSALSQLQTNKEFVNIRVIEEPSKGFFGFGSKPAVVEVELISSDGIKEVEKEQVIGDTQESEAHLSSGILEENEINPIDEAQAFLDNVLREMGLKVQITVQKNEEHVLFQVIGDEIGLMIGRRGQTLESLQYLTNIIANRYSKEYLRIVIDPENYRLRRQETLEQLADRVAKKVARTKTKVVLEPMNASERKIIHTRLQHVPGVVTKSEGEGPHRRIVIFPKGTSTKQNQAK